MIARAWLSPGFHPIPRVTSLIVSLAVALVTFERSRPLLTRWLPPTWAEASEMSRESLILLGPMVVALGTWVGGWRHTLAVGAIPARGWPRIAAAQIRALAAAVVIGHIVGQVPLMVSTAFRSTAGGPATFVILSGMTGLVALLALGYFLGVAWPSRLASPCALVGTYPLLIAPTLLSDLFPAVPAEGDRGVSFYSVALVWVDFGSFYGRRETLAGAVIRSALFAMLCGAAILAAFRIGERRPGHRWREALLPFVVPAMWASVMIYKQPVLIEPVASLECQPLQETSVCVPGEISFLLPEIASGAGAVVNSFGYGALTSVLKTDPTISNHVSFWYYGAGSTEIENENGIIAARYVSGEAQCPALHSGGAVPFVWEYASLLTYVIAARSGLDTSQVAPLRDLGIRQQQALERIEALSDAQLRRYLTTRHQELAACGASPPDELGP